ncbi:Oligosaccharyl transferase, STT3 subunit like protein [Aduncisulcus paluster]|uniref:dolichyl-diphosphooligosaccharide--protein glycotransferase n=1 Tax=Aduncisulcus paluster TaxID=2918883 RepID=A0ABQ5KPI5_9EUKA|nr:Oligosaccharyl transferase, STT3 subunit like protein [Aduncisulcus paluster]
MGTNTITLITVWIIAFSIRLFSIVMFEPMIHEFDPHFNWRATEFIAEHGIKAFLNWFDDRSWYPLGRDVGGTSYPGLMFTAHFFRLILQTLGISVSVKTVCIYLAPFMAGNTALMGYLWGKLLAESHQHFLPRDLSPQTLEFRKKLISLLSSFFMSCIPAFMSRSMSGSFDNEAVGVFALTLCFYLYTLAIEKKVPKYSVLSGVMMGFLALSWGGYLVKIFHQPHCPKESELLNSNNRNEKERRKECSSHVVNDNNKNPEVSININSEKKDEDEDNYSKNRVSEDIVSLCFIYLCWYVSTISLSYLSPYVGSKIFSSLQNALPHVCLGVIIMFALFQLINARVDDDYTILFYKNVVYYSTLGIFFLVVGFLYVTGHLQGFEGRLKTFFDPRHARKNIPIVASISEHQPAPWGPFYIDLCVIVVLLPASICMFLFSSRKVKRRIVYQIQLEEEVEYMKDFNKTQREQLSKAQRKHRQKTGSFYTPASVRTKHNQKRKDKLGMRNFLVGLWGIIIGKKTAAEIAEELHIASSSSSSDSDSDSKNSHGCNSDSSSKVSNLFSDDVVVTLFDPSPTSLFLCGFLLFSLWFTGCMIRLMLVLSPVVCVCAAYVCGECVFCCLCWAKWGMPEKERLPEKEEVIQHEEEEKEKEGGKQKDMKGSKSSKKGGKKQKKGSKKKSQAHIAGIIGDSTERKDKEKEKEKEEGLHDQSKDLQSEQSEQAQSISSLIIPTIIFLLLFTVLVLFLIHGVWISFKIYSNPTVMIAQERGGAGFDSMRKGGYDEKVSGALGVVSELVHGLLSHTSASKDSSLFRVMIDDFREMYRFIYDTMSDEAVIMSWWDYVQCTQRRQMREIRVRRNVDVIQRQRLKTRGKLLDVTGAHLFGHERRVAHIQRREVRRTTKPSEGVNKVRVQGGQILEVVRSQVVTMSSMVKGKADVIQEERIWNDIRGTINGKYKHNSE